MEYHRVDPSCACVRRASAAEVSSPPRSRASRTASSTVGKPRLSPSGIPCQRACTPRPSMRHLSAPCLPACLPACLLACMSAGGQTSSRACPTPRASCEPIRRRMPADAPCRRPARAATAVLPRQRRLSTCFQWHGGRSTCWARCGGLERRRGVVGPLAMLGARRGDRGVDWPPCPGA